MKFECDRCHAKYKISDEKVQGRVVRFPCRKCDHKILIDGRDKGLEVTVPQAEAFARQQLAPADPSSSSFEHEALTKRARSLPARRRSSSVPPRRASAASRRLSSMPPAASSALVGQHPGLAPPVPADAAARGASDEPAWHVSINDVPVGPIRLEEMAQKIDAAAVSEYSLVWRDGFEEWRPLATVPELMGLLQERRRAGPPPRPKLSSMPPFRKASEPLPQSSVPAASLGAPTPPSSSSQADFSAERESGEIAIDFGTTEIGLEPESGFPPGLREMSQPPAPLGPPEVFQSSPNLGAFSGLPPELNDPVSVPPVPPQSAAANVRPRRRGMSVGVLALMLAVVVFAAVLAFLAFDRYGDALLREVLKTNQPAKATPTVSPAEATPAMSPRAQPSPRVSPAVDTEEGAAEEPATEEPTDTAPVIDDAEDGEAEDRGATEEVVEPSEEGASLAPAPVVPIPPDERATIAPQRRKTRTDSKSTSAAKDSLSADEKRLLDDFGSSADAAPAKIAVKASGSSKSDQTTLDGDAVRATVGENKPRLQRCYERAVRGQQSPPSVRMDVAVTVAPSGRVRKASAVGDGPGGLAECIEASVRRWRFPASSEGGPAKFPIVFSGN